MRDAFSTALVEAVRTDPRVLLLTGDHGYALFDDLRRVCPEKYINAGVAEQNMVGVAAGLAKGGFRPVVYGLSAFIPVRVLEQIKMDVCYEELPVIFIGDGAGVVYSALGTSHQSTEDLAALRAVPHMTVLSPSDAAEMTACMDFALNANGPVYLRMGKADLGTVHTGPVNLQGGKPLCVQAGTGRMAFLATGSMVPTAMAAARRWPGSAIYSMPVVKPLHEAAIADICREHEVVATLEEHSIFGGLGSAVAEVAAAFAPTWVCRIGIKDRFSRYCGSYSYLMGEHGLDVESVGVRIEAFLARVNGGKTSLPRAA